MNFELSRIKEFITRQSWTFAKTMPTSPHEYVVKTKLSEAEQKEFEHFVLFIRRNGHLKKYKKFNYVHFDIEGWSYWTMGAPLEITTIINRHDLGFYDLLAEKYDNLFMDPNSLRENGKILEFIGNYLPKHLDSIELLDIGCGTGLLLDLIPSLAKNYLGVDPSGCMLTEFSKKHPGICLIQNTFEEQNFEKSEKFSLITSLFGSISYINPNSFGKILKLLKPNGKYFLMFYKPRYFPVTYQRTGICFSHYITDVDLLKANFTSVYEYSNYLIATNIELDK